MLDAAFWTMAAGSWAQTMTTAERQAVARKVEAKLAQSLGELDKQDPFGAISSARDYILSDDDDEDDEEL